LLEALLVTIALAVLRPPTHAYDPLVFILAELEQLQTAVSPEVEMRWGTPRVVFIIRGILGRLCLFALRELYRPR
jgi:hypothetical protein